MREDLHGEKEITKEKMYILGKRINIKIKLKVNKHENRDDKYNK